jgi:hypothetical protein
MQICSANSFRPALRVQASHCQPKPAVRLSANGRQNAISPAAAIRHSPAPDRFYASSPRLYMLRPAIRRNPKLRFRAFLRGKISGRGPIIFFLKPEGPERERNRRSGYLIRRDAVCADGAGIYSRASSRHKIIRLHSGYVGLLCRERMFPSGMSHIG